MKINLVGNCGVGKTTTALKISKKYQIPCLDLDNIVFIDNWQYAEVETIKEKIIEFQKHEDYIIVGDFQFLIGDIVIQDVDCQIEMQINYFKNMYRVTRRSLIRAFKKTKIHNNNYETFHQHFCTKDSMIYYTHKNYFKLKKQPLNCQYRVQNENELINLIDNLLLNKNK